MTQKMVSCFDSRSGEKVVGGPARDEESTRVVRDTGWAWMVLLAAHGVFLLWEGFCKGQGVLLPSLTVQFDTETWPVGLAIGLMPAARGVSGLLLGPLEKRWQPRTIALWSSILASAGIIAASFTTNVVQYGLLLVLLTGSGFGLLLNCSLVLVGRYFDKHYALANGVACSGATVGILASAPISQAFLDFYGWRGCLLLTGSLVVHLIPAAALYRPLPPQDDHEQRACAAGESGYQPLGADDDDEDAEGSSSSAAPDYPSDDGESGGDTAPSSGRSSLASRTGLDLFGDVSYVTLVVANSNLCALSVAWVIFTVPSAQAKGLSPYQASGVASLGALGMLIGEIGQGPLVDFAVVGARGLMYLANGLLVAPLAASPFLTRPWSILAGNFVFGLGFGVALPLSFTMLRRTVGSERMTVAVGWAEALGAVVRIAAGWMMGWVFDHTGSYDLSFVLVGLVPCLTIVAFLLEDVWVVYRARNCHP